MPNVRCVRKCQATPEQQASARRRRSRLGEAGSLCVQALVQSALAHGLLSSEAALPMLGAVCMSDQRCDLVLTALTLVHVPAERGPRPSRRVEDRKRGV